MNIFGVVILLFLFVEASIGGTTPAKSPAKSPTKPRHTSCQPYEIKIKSIIQGDNNRARIDDGANVSLTVDCKLSINGCITLSKGFKCAALSYETNIPTMITDKGCGENINICKALNDFGFGGKYPCPVPKAMKICSGSDLTIDLTKYADVLALAPLLLGELTGTAIVSYDGVRSDRFDVVVEIIDNSSSF